MEQGCTWATICCKTSTNMSRRGTRPTALMRQKPVPFEKTFTHGAPGAARGELVVGAAASCRTSTRMMTRSSFLLLAALSSCANLCGAFAPQPGAGLQDSPLGRGHVYLPEQHDSHRATATTAATSATAARAQHQHQHRQSHVRRESRRRRQSTALSMSTPDAAPSPPSSPPLAADAAPPAAAAAAAPAAPAFPESKTTIKPGAKISNEWELDVYSRPVVGADGKKLWELLICDSTGNLRHVSPIPSNMVNSREVRKTIEGVIEAAPGGSRPTVIRFFRNAMFNMIDIALKEVEVAVKPCRTTYAMYQWLEERERDVYPKMAGFKPTMKQPAFFDIRASRVCNGRTAIVCCDRSCAMISHDDVVHVVGRTCIVVAVRLMRRCTLSATSTRNISQISSTVRPLDYRCSCRWNVAYRRRQQVIVRCSLNIFRFTDSLHQYQCKNFCIGICLRAAP